ncbi:MAG: PHP domain-containing protein [Coriobacteriia bacterium]|nr:PHP domain-containing protein [Coriobacteriia bacterium]
MRFDLHVHTTASDGTLSPSQIVSVAASKNLAAVAITDHDTVSGVHEGLCTAAQIAPNLTVVPGVELSATYNGRDVHILGYFVNPRDESLRAHLEALRAARLERATCIVETLRTAGYSITVESVRELSGDGAVGRSHIARSLVQSGYAADVTDAFERLLGRGRPFYAPKDVRAPSEVISTIRNASGLPVLAHPGVTGVDDIISSLATEGLWGVEVYHPDHTPEQRAHYSDLAGRLGLRVTGGTDYHGPHAPGPALGELDMPSEILTTLLDAGQGGLAARTQQGSAGL